MREVPYTRRIDPAHAWGVVAVGAAGLVAIPSFWRGRGVPDDQVTAMEPHKAGRAVRTARKRAGWDARLVMR